MPRDLLSLGPQHRKVPSDWWHPLSLEKAILHFLFSDWIVPSSHEPKISPFLPQTTACQGFGHSDEKRDGYHILPYSHLENVQRAWKLQAVRMVLQEAVWKQLSNR